MRGETLDTHLLTLQREQMIRPLQTLSNLVAALLEGDYSIRVRGQRRDEPLGLAITEVNRLGEILREQRLGAIEATALLNKIMDEIDVAVFAFDDDDRLRLLNRGGERVLGAFYRGNPFFKHSNRGVTVAGIDELIILGLNKPRFGLLGTVIGKALSQKDRFGHFAILAATAAFMHQFRACFPIFRHPAAPCF